MESRVDLRLLGVELSGIDRIQDRQVGRCMLFWCLVSLPVSVGCPVGVGDLAVHGDGCQPEGTDDDHEGPIIK